MVDAPGTHLLYDRTRAPQVPKREAARHIDHRKATRIVLLFRALSSGSSGNAFVLRSNRVRLLFDAGLSINKLRGALMTEELRPESLSAVLISHEHTDHCISAADLGRAYGIPVWANADVLKATRLDGLHQARILEVGRPTLFGDVEVTSFPVSHDSVCPVGFFIRVDGRSIVIATDLGKATSEVVEAVSQADLVVLEANHDLDMLRNGSYPAYLRNRIAGPKGHLSNNQSSALLAGHLKSEDVEVWLAHLSKENNTPRLASRTVSATLKLAGLGGVALGVALRDRPSLRWTGVPRPRQLSLFAGLEGL